MPSKQRKRQGNSDTSRSPRRNQRGSTADTTRAQTIGAVGSDPKAAAKVGGKGDFGVPETGRERDRAYVSQETKSQDPGGSPAHSSGEAERVTGVGGNDSGVGSSSGGDVDTDIIGLGAGGSTVSQSGPDDRIDGKDMVSGDAPGLGMDERRPNQSERIPQPPPGAFVQHAREDDESTTGDVQGAAAVTNPDAQGEDSIMGELSMDDATGADNTRADRM
jgi:hypothetical protein